MLDYLELRDEVCLARIGQGGSEVCVALTSALDRAVEGLIPPEELGTDCALVALGGYGRGEMSPYSDVDLMVLHAFDDASEIAARVFRPLWDAKLRVGHSVRTVKEASNAAKERFETHTTLLTARLLAGDESLFGRLNDEIAKVTRGRPLRRYLVAEERERRRESPYLRMATDVKSGRGGLRTLHGFEWERRREALIGRFSAGRVPEEEVARESLLRVRNGLHAVVGRAYDVFSLDLRDPLARWLDMSVYEVSGMLVEAMETVDGLARRRWPEVGDLVASGRRVRSLGRTRPSVAQGSPDERLTHDTLVGLLLAGDAGRLEFERRWDQGDLSDQLPEWGMVRGVPQLAPFHEHPVGEHLWRTVDEMLELIGDADGRYQPIVAGIGSPDALLLAALFHDIGKGRGGDHSTLGAEAVRGLMLRLESPAEVADLVERAVRHHLLLAQTATRRDIDDPAVIDEVAAIIGDEELLDLVYLLTVADSKATGPSMWTDWKATLLGRLYITCAARLRGETMSSVLSGTTVDTVVDQGGEDRAWEIAAHLEAMPEEYLRSTSTDEVLWHLDLIDEMGEGAGLGVRHGTPVDTAAVTGPGVRGFRRLVAETFAANGIDVLEARLASRADGIVVDTFRVRDDRTHERVSEERWDQVRNDVEAALVGRLDTESKVARRAAAYASRSGPEIEPKVSASMDAASGDLVVTVECSDRVGRLAEILIAFQKCELEIRLAKLESHVGTLVDTFHVVEEATLDDLPVLAQRIASYIEP